MKYGFHSNNPIFDTIVFRENDYLTNSNPIISNRKNGEWQVAPLKKLPPSKTTPLLA
jgi:hypothetical protein